MQSGEAGVLSAPARSPSHGLLDLGPVRAVLSFGRAKPLAAAGALVILMMVVAAIAAPVIAPQDPARINSRAAFLPPSADHWFGTDNYGRDMFSRIVYGSRVALEIGLLGTLLGVGGGSLIGLVCGYFGGRSDMVLMRFVDAVQAFPGLILAMAIIGVRGPSLTIAFVAIAITLIARPARVVRASVLSAKTTAWVDAARLVGASDARIMFRHILPNVFAPIIVLASLTLGIAILIEASLSFLGLGVQPPTPAWGSMLSGAGANYFSSYPLLAIFPGAAISLAVFAFNLFGDGLRDVLDPRLRGSR
jgi:peptide/nickel transport system permease protein